MINLLSVRLESILNMVDECKQLADIGTDHGYLVIEAVKKGKAAKGVASDINKGPIEKAQKNVSISGLRDKVCCRHGSGLNTLSVGECDCIVIAGMGGNLIRDILEADMKIVKKCKQIILQPSQNPEVLRKYLYENGYAIEDEEICYDNGIFYEIMKVAYTGEKRKIQDIDYEISRVLLSKRNELFCRYIEQKIAKNNKVFEHINDDSEKARLRKEEILIKNKVLKEKLDEFHS